MKTVVVKCVYGVAPTLTSQNFGLTCYPSMAIFTS